MSLFGGFVVFGIEVVFGLFDYLPQMGEFRGGDDFDHLIVEGVLL